MALFIALGIIIAQQMPSGVELIQQCRIERTKALAATNDSAFADRRYLECLNRGQEE